MNLPWELVLGVVVVAIAALLLLRGRTASTPPPGAIALPYRKQDSLLTPAERAFYEVLLQAAGGSWPVFVKVRLADLVFIPSGTVGRQAAFNRIQSKHVDFVLCTPDTLRPVLVLELDDSSHQQPKRVARDDLVDNILEAAGLPLLRIPVHNSYVVVELRRAIEGAMVR